MDWTLSTMMVVYARNRVPTTEIVRLANCPATSRNAADHSFPPDFDPSKIKRRKGMKKDPQMTVRLMSPYSMRCKHCGEYICEYACGYAPEVQPLTDRQGQEVQREEGDSCWGGVPRYKGVPFLHCE